MKRLILLTLGIFSFALVQAQPFQFVKVGNLSSWGAATSPEISVEDFVQNTSSLALPSMKWEATSVSIPSGWQFYLCDPGACQQPGVTNANFYLDTGRSLMSVHFLPNNIPGNGSITVKVYETSNPSQFITKTFSAKATGVAVADLHKLVVNIYPNPATDWVSISAPKEMGEANIEIFNLLGRRVRFEKMNSANDRPVIGLEDLPRGNYLVRITPKNGSPITKTIQKN
jgi:Secretion system C-terminal sorting domain